LKYKNKKYAATVMGKFIAEYFSRTFSTHQLDAAACIIIPVPTSKKHLRTRGYNQALCIAREFAFFSGIPRSVVRHDIAVKSRTTKSQTECATVRERKENIRGSFAIKNWDVIRDKDIILIDDVHTTGATMSELSLLLKQNGARRILALVFAKT
jgi:competence protein ComFC